MLDQLPDNPHISLLGCHHEGRLLGVLHQIDNLDNQFKGCLVQEYSLLIGQTTTKFYLKRHMNEIDNRLLNPTTNKQC